MIVRKSLLVALGAVAATAGFVLLCAEISKPTLRGHITKAGVYTLTDSEKKIPERGSATGYVTEGGRTFQSAATNVALVKGTSFGFDFLISGAPTNRPLRLTHVITHPKMKKPDGTIVEKQIFDRAVPSRDGTIDGRIWYMLREDYELLPGVWTISVLHDRSVLVEKTFIVK